MAMMGLAFVTSYLSDSLISGFTTGSAFHVFIAQLNKIIDVKLPRHSGFGMLFFVCLNSYIPFFDSLNSQFFLHYHSNLTFFSRKISLKVVLY